MKTNSLIISEFLNAYMSKDALEGIKAYLTGSTEFMTQQGWKVHGNEPPTNREYLRLPTEIAGVWEYWLQEPQKAQQQAHRIEGMVSDTPLAQTIPELTEEAKQFIKEEAERMTALMPPCPKCGHKLNLMGVCPGCPQGNEGYKSKLTCGTPSCGHEEFFKETYQEYLILLKSAIDYKEG